MLDGLAARIRAYCDGARRERGDVVMGCVRLEASPGFVGIVYDKPGGSSAQFEAAYHSGQGFTILSPEGEMMTETDPERVFERFVAVIDGIPRQRRAAIDLKLAQWREQGYSGPRLRAMVLGFNTHYEGTRGGELAPEEMRYAAQAARDAGPGGG